MDILNILIGIIFTIAIPLSFKVANMIFRRWIYPDNKLKEDIRFIPRADGIKIFNHKLTVYGYIINISPYFDINIEKMSIRINDISQLSDYFIVGLKSSSIKKGTINNISFEKNITQEEKGMLLQIAQNQELVRINCIAEICSGKRRLEHGFEVTHSMVRSRNSKT